MLLNLDELEASENRFSAIQETPVRESLSELSEEAFITSAAIETDEAVVLNPEDSLEKRKEMLTSEGKEPVDFALERAIGKNDSVYSNFIELISSAKRKVGRIDCMIGTRNTGYATGFMVSDRLMLTNWHVFRTADAVADSEIQFFYELDINGRRPDNFQSFKLQSAAFFHSDKQLDYCFVAVSPVDVTGTHHLKDIGHLYLDPELGKLGEENKKEALNIIHHPNGDFKQLSIRENLFSKRTTNTIWYKSDTAPGSSGSPVFNDQWQVVALHHSGVAKKNEQGQYIDKDDNVIIATQDGKIDESKVVWIDNEGIRISVIHHDIMAKFPESAIVASLRVRTADVPSPIPTPILKDKEQNPEETSTDKQKSTEMDTKNTVGQVNISFPSSLVEAHGVINININTLGATQPLISDRPITTPLPAEPDFNEIKKMESELDFSGFRGYLSAFLGRNIPMPQPKPELRKFIARVKGTDGIVLKYHHYSVMLHTVRMMPAISAINVDGDPNKRKDETKRKDTWLRDSRIGFDVQLDDEYYKNSGFDRGHMSRREDANWGDTPEEAKRDADLTCMYTNACPQVGAINQSSRGGLWGILEGVVLESGALKEQKKTRKISVFNGPIFKETDPVYKGIQVPMSFYKIIFWLTDTVELKATAFKLAQDDLVGDIDFEQLNIDKNVEFKAFQCSIASLQNDTKLDFSDILELDTFSMSDNENMIPVTELAVKNHLDTVGRA